MCRILETWAAPGCFYMGGWIITEYLGVEGEAAGRVHVSIEQGVCVGTMIHHGTDRLPARYHGGEIGR